MTQRIWGVGVAIALLMASAGCSGTGYHRMALTGGYDDTQMADDSYHVVFEGNGYTTPQRAHDLALLRASDLCLGQGYVYFMILDKAQFVNASFATAGANVSEVARPHAEFTVKCLTTKPGDTLLSVIINAATFSDEIRTKYNISPNKQ
jgi:hypothetical protein